MCSLTRMADSLLDHKFFEFFKILNEIAESDALLHIIYTAWNGWIKVIIININFYDCIKMLSI